MLEVRKAGTRGVANLGWLKSRHSFSFGNYHDPDEMGFSDLRVINDDRIAPGRGFSPHAHRDMEIVTYVLEGAVAHKDSLGTGSVIKPGDVQIMSAGTGVTHSEYNHSKVKPLHLLQVWLAPKAKRLPPRYQQKHFALEQRRGCLRLLISANGQDGSLSIQQDARMYAGLFDGRETATLKLSTSRYAYVHVARGKIRVNGTPLSEGDGARVQHEQLLTLDSGIDSEVLVFDLRARAR
ncbi:pirin family protein [Pseudomonas cavernicola]|uniref:Pirin family protein n=1 Tax=Pseudomonas cavernicola TaxID=2320866 RepID=A0A418XNN4_9PSED|nr:pirin family protein [Pseudomonas cavernicola]RJG14046.1 pirin family protein [Pseudomonas cavernicola]